MGKIRDEQKQIIESFSCERLSDKQENRNLIKSFKSEKGRSLVSYLQHLAWSEDTECKTAYYLIKYPDGGVALFFSLKCGALFDPLDEDGRHWPHLPQRHQFHRTRLRHPGGGGLFRPR